MAQQRSPGPESRAGTIRQRLRAELAQGPATARELSQRVGVREKEIPEHLEHLARTLAAHGERLVIDPATCLECGFVFAKRERLERPGACPSCRSTRIDPPAFRVERLRGE